MVIENDSNRKESGSNREVVTERHGDLFCGPQIYPTTTLAHWWVTKEEHARSYFQKDLPTGHEDVKSGTEEESK